MKILRVSVGDSVELWTGRTTSPAALVHVVQIFDKAGDFAPLFDVRIAFVPFWIGARDRARGGRTMSVAVRADADVEIVHVEGGAL